MSYSAVHETRVISTSLIYRVRIDDGDSSNAGANVTDFAGPLPQTVAEVLMRADRTTLAELTRLVQRDQGIMGVSRAGKTKTKVTAANVSVFHVPLGVLYLASLACNRSCDLNAI